MSQWFRISDKANPNYLAKIVEIKNLRKHSNADRLQIFTVDGNNVITGLDAKEGDIGVYFPVESCINVDYLAYSNSFRDKALNVDKEGPIGFFEYHGRVRAIKLRGEKSEGYFVPIDDILYWAVLEPEDVPPVGTEFDIVGQDTVLVKKYIPRGNPAAKERERGLKTKAKETSVLVDGQFRFHEDTPQFGKNYERLNPNDLIALTYKLHGTSFVVSRILCKKRLSFWDKVGKFLGFDVQQLEYNNIYSSRKVVKNDRSNKVHKHYYKTDLWGKVNEQLKDHLAEGMTIYGEAIGFTESGEYIQKQYDYGCDVGQMAVYIYRITYTNPLGKVFELTWPQVKSYCNRFGLNHVPELYYGRAKHLFPISEEFNFQENFFERLKEQYLEKDCYICVNKVPAEGVTLRIDNGGDWEIYKLKSFRFLEKESKDLDAGVVDIETAETVEEEVG